MIVTPITTADQFAAALELRTEVFVLEQKVPPEEEYDAFDGAKSTCHVIALDDRNSGGRVVDPLSPNKSDVVGTGRLLAPGADGHPHIGRVAVAARARGTGVGRAIMEALEFAAVERYGIGGSVTVALSAQVHAIPFYEKLGYIVTGEQYLDAGIWHKDATKLVGH